MAAKRRDTLSERGNNVREVERTEALLQRQLARWMERTEGLRRGAQEKSEGAKRRMEELRGVHRRLGEERGEKGREVEKRRVRVEQVEKKVCLGSVFFCEGRGSVPLLIVVCETDGRPERKHRE